MVILFTSCEKVITVNVEDAAKKYVIEGTITDQSNSCRINISQTLNISDSNQYLGVENAVVTVREDNGNAINVIHSGGGFYRANVSGKPGHTYHLTVKIKGEVFTASSTMPQKVLMDTLFTTERPFLGKTRKIATLRFDDPKGFGNAYRFVQYIDGKKQNNIFVFDDNLIDGRQVVYELLFFDDQDFTLKTGDQLRVEMKCIDMPVYQFWNSLSQSSLGQSQSASPGNPITNITGGALGYFSANTFQATSITVK